jgi:hypothetical protein
VLRIERDRAAASELGQRNPMTLSVESKLDAAMHRSLAEHPLADAACTKEIDSALFQHAGAQRRFDLGAAARFQHDRVDTLEMKQVRKREARGSGADDADLRAARHRYAFGLNHDGARSASLSRLMERDNDAERLELPLRYWQTKFAALCVSPVPV